jgi:hypothetical protein
MFSTRERTRRLQSRPQFRQDQFNLAGSVLIAASILAARKLALYDGGKRVPATMSAIADAIRWAEGIMKEIDRRWPTR